MAIILIIEDHSDIRENTKEILEMNGHEVITAEDGKIGFDLAKEKQPDLILCDILMPVMDGFQVIRSIKENRITTHIPFVIFTANSEKKQIQNGLDLGAADYLVKPFSANELLAIVQATLVKKNKI